VGGLTKDTLLAALTLANQYQMTQLESLLIPYLPGGLNMINVLINLHPVVSTL
jgi:hypothetical protein